METITIDDRLEKRVEAILAIMIGLSHEEKVKVLRIATLEASKGQPEPFSFYR